eukprot:gene58088-biopygen101607
MILALPPRPPEPEEHESRRTREHRALLEWLQGRIARFARGDWLALLAEGRAAWPVRRRGTEQDNAADEDEAEARRIEAVNRACAAARDGQIARARQALCSTGMMPGTDATRKAVEKLLRPVGREPPDKDWIARGLPHARGLDPKKLAKRIRELGKGGAACMAGWYAEHLQLLLANKADFTVLFTYLDSITQCRMSSGFYDTLALQRTAPARKGLKNKVRPLVVPDTHRKICESTICEDMKTKFLQCLGPEQHAVGMTAAIEKLAKSVQCVNDAVDGIANGLIDSVSAYNHILREPILEEVESDCPEILALLATFMCRRSTYVFYDENGNANVIESADGVDQGAPMSPPAFAFGERRALRRIRARLEALRDEAV